MNIKTIYPSNEGSVVEIVTLGQAIDLELTIARKNGYVHRTVSSIMDNMLCCPCTEITFEPVGKTVTPNNFTYDDSAIYGE